MPTFDAEYARLNRAQRDAVDAIEGPVMVVAGPGTGKTQVLSVRVANILKKTHARPRNILCLTFTTSGAAAMRERLRSLIGADAYGVTINTIHGFCNEVIAQHPHVFEEWSALEMISDVEQIRAMNRIIDGLMPDLEIVSRKSPHARTMDILARIAQVKREGVSVEKLRAAADAYEQDLASRSKEGTKAHEKNLAAARKFRDFVRLFEGYGDMLLSTQRYDYEDMILHVLRAFDAEDWMLAGLQERYLYILVDEFQDTNGSQFQVIEKLITPRTKDDRPNIFVVGDDDQAIYRFQGANLTNILAFRERFTDATIVVLTESYRCSQPILDAAGALIAHNTERLTGRIPGLTKDLTAASNAGTDEPLLLFAPSDAAEPWLIADRIEEEITRGTPSSGIAVLVQTNAELRPLYDVLRARSLPVRMDGKINLLDHPLVLQTVSILRAIHEPESSVRFSAALAAECFACHPADLARLWQAAREEKRSLYAQSLALDDPAGPCAALPWQDRDALLHARDTLLRLHQQLPNRTLLETMERVFMDCKVLRSLSSLDPIDFAALQAFFEFVKYRFYEQKQRSFSFEALMHDLALYSDGEYGLRLTYTMPHLTREGVQLLTAHQSKGMEFDVVILPNFRDGHWDGRRNPPSVSIPEDLLFGWDGDQRAFEKRQDERRVAYVAMTRARHTLILSCPAELSSGGAKPKSVSPSGFAVEAGIVREEKGALKNPDKCLTLLFQKPKATDEGWRTYLLERVSDFKLSATALNHFLEDPQLFLEQDLLQKPQAIREALVYGNAAHWALKKWGRSVQEGLPLSREQFLHAFEQYLAEREALTDAQRSNLTEHGRRMLPRYYDEILAPHIPVIHRVEMPVSAFLGSVPIKGTMDRIDLDHPESRRVTVIDYKTGQPKTEKQIREDGDYFRQLAFYALLMEHGMPTFEPVAFVLDFIGEGTEHPIQRKFTVTEQEKRDLAHTVDAVWTKIQNLDFTPV